MSHLMTSGPLTAYSIFLMFGFMLSILRTGCEDMFAVGAACRWDDVMLFAAVFTKAVT